LCISEELLEVKDYTGEGYSPVVDFESWRVAILNYCDELLPQNIYNMQRHNETDEVFVLLKGDFILYIGEGKEKVEKIHAVKLQPFKMYNVKKGVWHNHTLSKDASVLIVENRETSAQNSPRIDITPEQRQRVADLASELGI